MNTDNPNSTPPLILAPAGGPASFLAALAAGADAVYCGLKQFSARMEAKNFGIDTLAGLTRLAHEKGTRVYVTMNSLLKPGDLEEARDLIYELESMVSPDALICQDLAMVELARGVGFKGEIHLSTLANVTFPEALSGLPALGVRRVVLPRELSVDEIKGMAAACPSELDLEVFIHGALCYAVSGRCYWSSFLGGKSGLRGRCVQPCRRIYTQDDQTARLFSCMDLSLDVLVKVLKGISKVRVWKIEGRKKGPHYVYYTVKAYQMLRDNAGDPTSKKAAVELLERALGRPGTHYNFLPQRPQVPIEDDSRTGSGLFLGSLKGTGSHSYLQPREALLPGDTLRVGYEDAAGHRLIRIHRYIPKGARFVQPEPKSGERAAGKGTPVFLTDRREKALADQMDALERSIRKPDSPMARKTPHAPLPFPKPCRPFRKILEMNLFRKPGVRKGSGVQGVWISQSALDGIQAPNAVNLWWWLPPVIWPDMGNGIKNLIHEAMNRGCRTFVLNAPWQRTLFPAHNGTVILWAGPFCNIANALAIKVMADMGISGIIISPELGREDLLGLPAKSTLPLGVVVSGLWPLCISRTASNRLTLDRPFNSPKGEAAFTVQRDADYWTYPNWELDLSEYRQLMIDSGYRLFVKIREPIPKEIEMKKREGVWNWNLGLS